MNALDQFVDSSSSQSFPQPPFELHSGWLRQFHCLAQRQHATGIKRQYQLLPRLTLPSASFPRVWGKPLPLFWLGCGTAFTVNLMLGPGGWFTACQCAHLPNKPSEIPKGGWKRVNSELLERWLAKVGYERLGKIENPELTAKRMRGIYEQNRYFLACVSCSKSAAENGRSIPRSASNPSKTIRLVPANSAALPTDKTPRRYKESASSRFTSSVRSTALIALEAKTGSGMSKVSCIGRKLLPAYCSGKFSMRPRPGGPGRGNLGVSALRPLNHSTSMEPDDTYGRATIGKSRLLTGLHPSFPKNAPPEILKEKFHFAAFPPPEASPSAQGLAAYSTSIPQDCQRTPTSSAVPLAVQLDRPILQPFDPLSQSLGTPPRPLPATFAAFSVQRSSSPLWFATILHLKSQPVPLPPHSILSPDPPPLFLPPVEQPQSRTVLAANLNALFQKAPPKPMY